MGDSQGQGENTGSGHDDQILKRLDELQKYLEGIPGGGMLSSADFLSLVVPVEEEEQYLKAHEEREWTNPVMFRKVPIETYKEVLSMEQEKPRFFIKPFNPLNVTPFSYDLSIGEEVFLLREREEREPKKLVLGGSAVYMEPGDTALILTEEQIALPPHYSATVWPRFGIVREGIFQSMVKIDPTWRGNLAVALVNLSPATYPIKRGKLFGTLIIYELARKSRYNLARPGDLEAITVRLDPDFVRRVMQTEIRNALEKEDLSKLRELVEHKGNYQLEIKRVERTASDFDKLRRLYSDDEWQAAIKQAISEVYNSPLKGMEALGLKNLNRILEGTRVGQRLQAKELPQEFKQQDLEKVALDYGGAFKWLYGIPKHIMKDVDERIKGIKEELKPSIQADVSADLYPKVVSLTLSVLGLLSLIAVTVGLYLRTLTSPISGIDFPASMLWAASVIGIVDIVALVVLLMKGGFRSRLDEKRVKILEKGLAGQIGEIDSLKKELDQMREQIKRQSQKP
jgi:deoxycytidine triphosphate deaminase